MNKLASFPTKYYNYRIEFQFRGAPHAHGVLWVDWERVIEIPKNVINNFIEAKNLIRHSQKLSSQHRDSMSKVADFIISVSLRNPAVCELVKEVQVHKRTAKACKKYGTKCRFNFPKLPIHRTIISSPSNYFFDDEQEKTSGREECKQARAGK